MVKDGPKIMCFLHFLTLYVLCFAIFNPICTITLHVLFLALHVIFLHFLTLYNPYI